MCYGALLQEDAWRQMITHGAAMIARTEANMEISAGGDRKNTSASEGTASQEGFEEKCQEKHMHMSCRSTREQLSALLGSKVCKSRVPQTSKRSLRSPRKPWSLEHVLDFQLWYTPTLHVELVVVLKNIVFLRAKRKPPVAPRVIVQLHRCRTRNCE